VHRKPSKTCKRKWTLTKVNNFPAYFSKAGQLLCLFFIDVSFYQSFRLLNRSTADVMNRVFVFALAMFLSFHTLSAQSYPEWFLYPAKYPNVVTGFSYNRTDPAVDAERMYCVYRECVVDGKFEVYNNEQNDLFLVNSDYFYYFSDSTLQAVQGSMYCHDSFISSVARRDIIGAFSTDSNFEMERKFLRIESLPTPAWTEQRFWTEGGYAYGVGIYTARGSKNDAWKTAEEKAYFQILTSTAVKMYSMRISEQATTGDKLETATVMKLKFSLRNIEVLERWHSLEKDQLYVLVRIKQQDVKSPFVKPTFKTANSSSAK
jgi:hypothetical protein